MLKHVNADELHGIHEIARELNRIIDQVNAIEDGTAGEPETAVKVDLTGGGKKGAKGGKRGG
jgi:hypothetical protein